MVSIVLIGPPGSGKTAFRRAVLHQPFSHVYKKGFLSKHETYMHIDDVSVSVDLWDATEDSWPAISQLIPHVVIVCLDISDPLSLDKVIKSQVRTTYRLELSIFDAILLNIMSNLSKRLTFKISTFLLFCSITQI